MIGIHRSSLPETKAVHRCRSSATGAIFGLHMPARLFTFDNDAARSTALESTLTSLDQALGEPIRTCLARDAEGRHCVEATTPIDLRDELELPGGHIFHRDLTWPYAENHS